MILYPKPAAVLIRDSLKIGNNPLWVGQTAINDFSAFEKQVGVPNALENFSTITAVAFQPTDPEMKDWANRLKKLLPTATLLSSALRYTPFCLSLNKSDPAFWADRRRVSLVDKPFGPCYCLRCPTGERRIMVITRASQA